MNICLKRKERNKRIYEYMFKEEATKHLKGKKK